MRTGLLLILFAVTINIFSQEYFNTRFYFDGPTMPEGALNALEIDDGYIITGNTDWWNKMSMAKISLEGEVIWTKNWGELESEWWNSRYNSFISHFNSYYTIGSKNTWYNSIRHVETLLTKYDNNFDTVWTSVYGKKQSPYDSSFITRSFTGIENGFAVTGTLEIYYEKNGMPNSILNSFDTRSSNNTLSVNGEFYEHEPFLLKMDSLGNVLWEQNFPNSSFHRQSNSIIQTSDGGYALGGYRWVYLNEKGDPIVIKTDSLGNKEWELSLGGPYQDGTAIVCNSQDGNIVVASHYDVDSLFFGKYMSRIQLTKIDLSGNILWNKLFADKASYFSLKNVRQDSSGGYIISGATQFGTGPNEPNGMGYILRVSAEGDSLWYRKYAVLWGQDSRNSLYDAIPTSDGGFLGAGGCSPIPPDTGNQDAWVIKIDSMGCTSISDCWVGEPEWKWITTEEGNKIMVYPNPAQNWFTIKLNNKKSNNDKITIEIYDLYGRKVNETEMPNGENNIRYYVSNWNRGIYFVRVKSGNIVLGSVKMVLE